MLHEEYLKLKEDRQHGNFLLPYVWYKSIMPEYYSSYPVHWHDEFEVIIIKKGKMNININLNNIVVNEGDIVFVKPKVLHGFGQYEEEEVETATVVFSLSMMSAQVADACSVKYFTPLIEGTLDFPEIIHPGDACYKNVRNCLLNMSKVYHDNDIFFELSIKSELFKMFYYLFKEYCTERIISATNNSDATTIKKIIEYIQTHYQQTITIAALAEVAGLSEHYLMRYFKQNMGITCVDYINEYRLNIATHLLAETDYPVGIIAEKCGIPNASYFNRLFKKTFGITPKDYRRKKNM